MQNILIQLDSDPQPSVFDAVVAVDSGVDHLFRHHGVTRQNVRDLVHGAMFTRGPNDLHHTALFIGGSDMEAGEALLAAATGCFFGPMRVSVMLDPNGSNTTAAAAVLAAAEHVDLSAAQVLVLAGTGPVGSRVARLVAGRGGRVRVASRKLDRAKAACDALGRQVDPALLSAVQVGNEQELDEALAEVQVVVAAGAAGVELLPLDARRKAARLKVAIDLNAVPPAGIEGIAPGDRAAEHDDHVCYGAIGVGGTKMKIHRRAIQRLFESNDQVLDAEQILAIGEDTL